MIMLQIKAVVEPAKVEDYLRLAKELTKNSQNEAGCVFYHLLQDEKAPNVFYVAELWESEEALKNHQETAHFKTLAPQLKAMRIETVVWKNHVLV